MRTFLLLPAVVLSVVVLSAMPAAHAQQRDAQAPRATAAATGIDADAADADGGDADVADEDVADAEDVARAGTNADAEAGTSRSGFGQVMSVLTGLLQDAAQREATGRSDGFALDNPAIEISVTPVEGRTALLRTEAGGAETRHAEGGRQLARGNPR